MHALTRTRMHSSTCTRTHARQTEAKRTNDTTTRKQSCYLSKPFSPSSCLSLLGTNAFLLCFSIVSRDSAQGVAKKWLEEVKSMSTLLLCFITTTVNYYYYYYNYFNVFLSASNHRSITCFIRQVSRCACTVGWHKNRSQRVKYVTFMSMSPVVIGTHCHCHIFCCNSCWYCHCRVSLSLSLSLSPMIFTAALLLTRFL